MRIFTIITLCLMPVTQAIATEFCCYPPDPASYFQTAQASPHEYRTFVGLSARGSVLGFSRAADPATRHSRNHPGSARWTAETL